MVVEILVGLDPEGVLRIPHVLSEVRGHLVDVDEQARERLAVGADQRVLRLGHVVGRFAGIGVDDHLHAVANVVFAVALEADSVGVGELVGRGVSVIDPVELAVRYDDVGIAVVFQERGDRRGARLDVPLELQPGLAGDRVREDDPRVLELDRVDQFPERRAELNAATAVVGRVDVLAALRVVELPGSGVDDGEVRGRLAVVDPRLRDLDAGRGVGRDVLEVELGKAVGGHLADRRHRDAEAMGVDEVPVHPGAGFLRQRLELDLPGGDHHLAFLAIDLVAVDIDVRELVVGPEDLELVIGRQERPRVPEPDVVYRAGVVVDLVPRQRVVDLELLLVHAVERERLVGELDLVFDILPFLVELVRLHDEVLVGEAGEVPEQQEADEQGDRDIDGPGVRPPDVRQHDHPAERRRDREQAQQGEEDGLIRGAHPEDHAPFREQQLVPVEEELGPGEKQEHADVGHDVAVRVFADERVGRRRIDRHLLAALPGRFHHGGGPGLRCGDERPDVERQREGEPGRDHELEEIDEEVQHRERVDVERHVPAEHRIRCAERRGVHEAEDGVPGPGLQEPDDDGASHDGSPVRPRQVGRPDVGEVGTGDAQRGVEHREADRRGQQEEPDAITEHDEEDVPVALRGEPEELAIEGRTGEQAVDHEEERRPAGQPPPRSRGLGHGLVFGPAH